MEAVVDTADGTALNSREGEDKKHRQFDSKWGDASLGPRETPSVRLDWNTCTTQWVRVPGIENRTYISV